MIRNYRLGVVSAVLALATAITCTHVWGEPGDNTLNKFRSSTGQIVPEAPDSDLVDDLAQSKFARGGLLTYRTSGGETLFAYQLQPKLDPLPPRPRDLLLLVDTSASQVKGPLVIARQITETLVQTARPEDRIALWTVNTSVQQRTRSFLPPQAEALQQAVQALKLEVPLGDADLKGALEQAARAFPGTRGHQQVLLYLGDGMSIHNPIENNAQRAQLAEDLVKREIAFFTVPLGPKLEPANLHGLATGTGGTVIRVLRNDKPIDLHQRLQEALVAPILYPQNVELPAAVQAAFPSKLPPLRPDVPTLVVGRLQPGEAFRYSVSGTVAQRPVRVEETLPIPEVEADNFFLVSLVAQWQRAQDQPALIRADRALAFAADRNQLARADLLAQAQWALSADKLEAAQNLFEQARQLDPNDVEAAAGVKVVQKLRSGALQKEQLLAQLARPHDKVVRLEKKSSPAEQAKAQAEAARDRLLALAQADEKIPVPAPVAPAGPAEREDLLQLQKQKLAIEEQHVTQVVEDAERQARRLLPTDPDAAHDLLKQTLAAVRDNPDLSDKTRQALSNRLESALRNADTQGALIKRERDEELKRLADSRRRFETEEQRVAVEERTRRRMVVFANLMREARFEQAAAQALAIAQDAIDAGTGVPPSVTAGYVAASNAYHVKEIEELRRLREERYLLTMMQVERSHMPFPDEPPIQYPPAATWRELTRLRKDKYESSGLADDDPTTLRKIKEMQSKLAKPVNLEKGIDPNTPLQDALEFLTDRYDLTILIDTQAFDTDLQVKEIETQPVKLPKMMGVSLATVLRLLLAQVNGTYLVRRDYVEVTTGQRATAEKTLRVYPVADLVIPIPNSVNTQSVNQQLTILGTAPGIGLQLGSPLALAGPLGAAGLGGFGALGALGGAGITGLGIGIGGIPGAAALGFAGAGIPGGGGGFGGSLGFAGGQVNLGVGGGALGYGGGQLGQYGNLGGQFGLQGGTQELILIQLIRQVIGTPGDWAVLRGYNTPAAVGGLPVPGGGMPEDDPGAATDIQLANDLGYFPPALALVVKGTSRIHTQVGGLLSPRPGAFPGGMGAAQGLKEGALVIGPRNSPLNKLNRVAAAPRKEDKAVAKASTLRKDLQSEKGRQTLAQLDPKKIWQEALEKGVQDPGLIIAVTDFLAELGKFEHVAEFLKANLRQGIVVRPWVYEALATALEASGGSPEEIERARVSFVDLQPQDAQGYLKASQALSEQKRYDRAVALCRQAAVLEPNAPSAYAEALVYAELARDSQAMEWAAGKLLGQDWPSENEGLHATAQAKLQALSSTLKREQQHAQAERMETAASDLKQRDLVIQLMWQGDADLDLEIKEPIGTVCSFLQRQTPGGGIMLGDKSVGVRRETYVAAQAFTGEYQVTVRRIWGRPEGGKATLEIYQNKDTPRQTIQRQTIHFDRSHTLTIGLDHGRRTTAAYVPSPASRAAAAREAPKPAPSRNAFTKLRALADPELSATEVGMRGGVASLGLPTATPKVPEKLSAGMVAYQTKVAPLVGNSADLTARATVLGDGRLRVSVSPIFQTINGSHAPTVANPLIPGGFEPLAR